MRFEIPRSQLLSALRPAVAATCPKGTIPILKHVLVKHTRGMLEFMGSDSEIEITTCINVQQCFDDNDYGEITVPAAKFLDIVKNLPEGLITFLEKDDRVEVRAGKSRFTLSTLSADDFPSTMEIDDDATVFTIGAGALNNALAQCSYAMASSDARVYLNGLCLDMQAERLVLCATDGHRLAMISNQEITFPNWQENVILPRNFVIQLTKLLPKDGDIEIRVERERCIQIKLDNLIITSKLIDGKFPDYLGVIPDPSYWMVAEISALKQALDQAAILSNEKYKGVRLVLTENELTVTATNPDNEESEVKIDVEYHGEALEIGFNVNYLRDAISSFGGSHVSLGFKDCNSSILVKMQQDSDDCQAVVMPMRL